MLPPRVTASAALAAGPSGLLLATPLLPSLRGACISTNSHLSFARRFTGLLACPSIPAPGVRASNYALRASAAGNPQAATGAAGRASRLPSERRGIMGGAHARDGRSAADNKSAPADGAATAAAAVTATASTATSADVPSLEELRAMLEARGVRVGERFRLSTAKQRLFGAEEKDVRVVLIRDNSAWCPYCERVWLQLEEKQIPYIVDKVNMRCYGSKPDWFMRMVPSGLLPVMQLDGRTLTESLDIMVALEAAFPSHAPLLPDRDDRGRQAHLQRIMRNERQLAGAWMQWGRTGDGGGGGRGGGFWGGVMGGGGGGAGVVSSGQRLFEQAVDAVEKSLEEYGGPLFMGEEFSFADAVYAPFLERIAASTPFWHGLTVRANPRWPNLSRWFDTMDARPSYQAMKSDDFTVSHTLEPQLGPIALSPSPAAVAHRAFIEGIDGTGAWDLPLRPEVTAWGADAGDSDLVRASKAREEAAESLVKNHELLVGFCLRSLKQQQQLLQPSKGTRASAYAGGVRRYRSEGEVEAAAARLAPAVGEALRRAAHSLLMGVEGAAAGATAAASTAGSLVELVGEEGREEVAVAVAYLRDRVGVPRDLTYPAARQLRAHLQRVVRELGSQV